MGHLSRRRVEFWRFSSKTNLDHKAPPLTQVRRAIILNLWEEGKTMDFIAFRVKLDVDTVRNHIRRARKAGDPRAVVRHAATLKAMEMAK
jgi:DNA-binding NarL/FixJ family response regulator